MSVKTPHIVLATDKLCIGYIAKKKNTTVVSDIHLQLEAGQLVGLIGINGAGKSTLLRTLAGLQTPISGGILMGAKGIETYTPEALAQELSVVLTGQMISKNLTVFELVALGRQPYTNWLGTLTPNDVAIIAKALEATNCEVLKDRPCYALSDGQLQRVLIARALAQDTPLIFMDEPLTHLDLHHKASLLKLLTYIAKTQDKTILFSTHDIEHAIPLCDHMIVLQDGKAILNTPKKLIEDGVFDRMFPEDTIRFDRTLGRFFVEN
ncbi:MAG: iron complex transport system ATP-binding protein [Flavobacteriales bacterium]|jgi:iron complex transport system ATP-binding protein